MEDLKLIGELILGLLKMTVFTGVALAVIVSIFFLLYGIGFLLTWNEDAEIERIERINRKTICKSAEGMTCKNVLRITVPDCQIVVEGFSNVYHTVNTFVGWYDRVERKSDGITIYFDKESVFVPTDMIQRISVENEYLLRNPDK